MNKFNPNKIITICIILLISVTWLSKSFVSSLAKSGYRFIKSFDVIQMIDEVDDISKKIRYKNRFIDINSFYMQKTGIRKVIKDANQSENHG